MKFLSLFPDFNQGIIPRLFNQHCLAFFRVKKFAISLALGAAIPVVIIMKEIIRAFGSGRMGGYRQS